MWGFWLILLMAILATGWVNTKVRIWGDTSAQRIRIQEMKENQAAYLEIVEHVRQEVENDTYGGATPEETLRLFVDAFRVRDAELASKYLILEEREGFIEEFNTVLAEGRLDDINYLPRVYDEGTVEVFERDGYKRIRILMNDGSLGFVSSIRYNEFTKIWKLRNW